MALPFKEKTLVVWRDWGGCLIDAVTTIRTVSGRLRKTGRARLIEKGIKSVQPAMTTAEFSLFQNFLRCSVDYAEFGCGGSTVEACKLAGRSVTSIDSSETWLNKVADSCKAIGTRIVPTLMFADVGKTGEWGYPDRRDDIDAWTRYISLFWTHPNYMDADLYLIDGRSRVACFMNTLLHASSKATIIMHDFSDRPDYHVVRDFTQEIATVERLAAFRRRNDQDNVAIKRCLDSHRLNWA